MAKVPLHIQHNVDPTKLAKILEGLAVGRATREIAAELGVKEDSLPKRMIPFIRQLGLIGRSSHELTDLGLQYYGLKQRYTTLFPEAVHHLLYTAAVFDAGNRFSWAYATVVDALWTVSSRVLDAKAKAQLVGKVVEEAGQTFGVPTEEIAFSDRSIGGVLNWLRALDPPVVTRVKGKELFRRRYFCSAVVFLWAVDFLYRAQEKPYGVRVFLTPERIDRLCKLCVLDQSGLDNVLATARRASDYNHNGIFDYGTEGGFGRWLLLARPCPAPSLPEEVRL